MSNTITDSWGITLMCPSHRWKHRDLDALAPSKCLNSLQELCHVIA